MSSILASSVMQEHVRAFGSDMEAWLDGFRDDAVLELPHLKHAGAKSRFKGRRAIKKAVTALLDDLSDFHLVSFRVYEAEDRDMVFAEFEVEVSAKSSRQRLRHTYSARMIVNDRKIVFLRQCLDCVVVPKASI